MRAALGGRHPGRGTHNALISLGRDSYLEIIGPDPSQLAPEGGRSFDIDALPRAQLRTWAVKAPAIDGRVQRARDAGYDPGEPRAMSRERPDGQRLAWRLTAGGQSAGAWLVPFLIDWGDSPHPAPSAPGGIELEALRAEHPRPQTVTPLLEALGVELAVTAGPTVRLIATLHTPGGTVELR